MSDKPYRCNGSFIQGSACANRKEKLPEGVKECVRCTEKEYTKTKAEAAVAAEVERTKDLPADRVKKTQTIIVKNK